MTKTERQELERVRGDLAYEQRHHAMLREEYGRFDTALNALMVAVAHAACRFPPTSIASAELIDALAQASRTVHSRRAVPETGGRET